MSLRQRSLVEVFCASGFITIIESYGSNSHIGCVPPTFSERMFFISCIIDVVPRPFTHTLYNSGRQYCNTGDVVNCQLCF